jgi:hypothetical protein
MRTETGQAIPAAALLDRQREAARLSNLVGRVAASRGLHLEPHLSVAPSRRPAMAPGMTGRPPGPPGAAAAPLLRSGTGCALLAAHGGAGVSCLLRAGLAGAGAVDAERAWPACGPVLLVARTSTYGLEAARDAARTHAHGDAGPDVALLGLVLVADAPGRLPPRIRSLADLVTGAFQRMWQVPWLTEWRLAAADEPLPAHPEVTRLITDLRALTGARLEPATAPRGDAR